MHKLLDKDGAQHLVDKFLSDQGLQDNNLNKIEDKLDFIYSVVGVEHYGIKIDKNNSDTSARIVYTHDCENYTPAHMDYTNGVFEIGSWGNAFFMKNNYPAMCNFYGVEQYKLDPDDHSLKEDGVTVSDVADVSYNGNAMSVFDCHIWMKFWEDDNYQYLEVSNYKLDDDFKDYPYVRSDGSKADKLYYPMYPGYKDSNNRLRSISGVKASSSSTTAQEVTYASNCGDNWSIGDWSHYLWLHSLMLLISKDFNSQTSFGNGNMDGGSSASDLKTNGLLNASGRFFGYNTSSDSMKAFFCENVYANCWQRLLGFYNDKGTYKIKMTPPYTYDETFDGYDTVQYPTVPSSSNYLKDFSFSPSYGLLPKTVGGTATTWVGDYFYTNNLRVDLLLAGGSCYGGANNGSWFLSADFRATVSDWSGGASSYLTEPIHFDLNTIYGSSPIHFEQDNYAEPLSDYTILGNSYQDGVPDPDNPVEVVSVGDRTENLFNPKGYANEYFIDSSGALKYTANWRVSAKIKIAQTETYTISFDTSSGPAAYHAIYDENDNVIELIHSGTKTFTVSEQGSYARFSYRSATTEAMMNVGTIAFPYVPYGYKIPITCGGVTQNIYLDEPLRKQLSGDAADALNFATQTLTRRVDANCEPLVTPTTSSITLPTLNPTPDNNTLSIGTTLQPSEVSITGHIKPSSTYGQLLDVNNQAILDKNGDQIFVYGQS